MKYFLLLFLLALAPVFSHADVVTEGEVSHRFTILNLDDYPDYEFYVLRQSYHYDMGYQPGSVEEVIVTQGEYFLTGDRDATSPLYARPKAGGEVAGESGIQLGGKEVVADRNAEYVRDDYRILSIKDGVIELELVDQAIMLRGGKSVKVKKGAISTGIEVLGIDLIYIALPVVCLLGILFFFLYRRRKARNTSN